VYCRTKNKERAKAGLSVERPYVVKRDEERVRHTFAGSPFEISQEGVKTNNAPKPETMLLQD